MPYQPYTVLYYVVGFNERNLSSLPSSDTQTQLVNYIESHNGTPDGDQWYRFDDVNDLNLTIQRTKDLGGYVYGLDQV